MAWLERFTFVMRSSFTALRDKVEDPERLLHQLICDMEEELDAVRHSVAAAIADEIQLSREVETARASADQWATRAEKALQGGNETTARQALEQKLRAEDHLQTLEASYESQQEQTGKLQSAYRDLEDKIRQARHKRTLLVARLARAESSKAISTALDRAEGQSAFAEFSRLERKVDRAEAMSDAYDRLAGRDPEAEELAADFAKQEHQDQLERELAALKQRLASQESQ